MWWLITTVLMPVSFAPRITGTTASHLLLWLLVVHCINVQFLQEMQRSVGAGNSSHAAASSAAAARKPETWHAQATPRPQRACPDPHAPPPTYADNTGTGSDDGMGVGGGEGQGPPLWSPLTLSGRPLQPSRLSPEPRLAPAASSGSLAPRQALSPSPIQHTDADGRPISVLSGAFIDVSVARSAPATPEPAAAATGGGAAVVLPGGLPSPSADTLHTRTSGSTAAKLQGASKPASGSASASNVNVLAASAAATSPPDTMSGLTPGQAASAGEAHANGPGKSDLQF